MSKVMSFNLLLFIMISLIVNNWQRCIFKETISMVYITSRTEKDQIIIILNYIIGNKYA